MNLIYLLVSTLLLWNSCFAAEFVRVGNPEAEEELVAWLTAATERPMISPILWGMFRARYPKYEVQLFTGNVLAFYGRKYRLTINDETKSIHIAEYGLAVKIMEYFGRAIEKLYISADFSKVVLENMTHPFRIEALRMDIKHNITIESQLSELFPDVQDLSLKLEGDVDYSYLNGAFTNLKSLDVGITNAAWKRKEQIEALFWENQHVIAISFSGFPSNYIKTISRLVPNVEILTLYGFDTANETVTFDNVKHLILYGTDVQSGSPGTIEYLLCPKLKSLEFFYSPRDFNAWRTFFRNHPNLIMINLREGRIQDYRELQEGVQLMQLISTQLNLLTFTMHQSNFFSLELIKNFVESHSTLKMFHITSHPDTIETMVIRMPTGNWQICVMQDQQLVFAGGYDEYESLLKRARTQQVDDDDYDD